MKHSKEHSNMPQNEIYLVEVLWRISNEEKWPFHDIGETERRNISRFDSKAVYLEEDKQERKIGNGALEVKRKFADLKIEELYVEKREGERD